MDGSKGTVVGRRKGRIDANLKRGEWPRPFGASRAGRPGTGISPGIGGIGGPSLEKGNHKSTPREHSRGRGRRSGNGR